MDMEQRCKYPRLNTYVELPGTFSVKSCICIHTVPPCTSHPTEFCLARAPHSDHFHLHATAITLAAFLDTLLLVDDLKCKGNLEHSRIFKTPLHLACSCATSDGTVPPEHEAHRLRLSCDGHLLGVARIHPQPQNVWTKDMFSEY